MKFLLKFKSWQLFIVLILPLFISSYIPLILPYTYVFLDSLWIIVYILWLNTLSMHIQRKLPKKLIENTQIISLQIITYFTIVCFILIPILTIITVPYLIVISIFIISFIGILFIIVFSAKMITIIDTDRNSLVLSIILLVLYPIGVWIIQPQIKEFFNVKTKS